MKEDDITHKQHYVPQMYLKNFAVNKQCYVMYQSGDIRVKNIKNICYETDMYEFKSSDGQVINPNLYEKNLFGRLESYYSKYFENLILVLDKGESLRRFMKTEDNKKTIILWMVSMLLRSPMVFDITQDVAKEIGIEWDAVQSRNNAILHNTSIVEHATEKTYKTHKLVMLENKTDYSFLTSGFPCIIIPDESLPLNKWLLPLTPKYYVLLIDKKAKEANEYDLLPAPVVLIDEYNQMMVRNRYGKYVISKDLETLQRYQHILNDDKKVACKYKGDR